VVTVVLAISIQAEILDLTGLDISDMDPTLLRVSLYFTVKALEKEFNAPKINWVNSRQRPVYPAPDLSFLDDRWLEIGEEEETTREGVPALTSLLRLSSSKEPTAELALERLVGSALIGIFHVKGCKVLS
jgi:hypothetical protein